MTEKKESILNTALELFANEGYASISTSRISKEAKVSEGLIFRHFQNKKGLLDAIMKSAESKIHELFTPIFLSQDPIQVIMDSLEIPFNISEQEYNYWRLLFKLKWESDYNNEDKMKPVLEKFTWAFIQLGYESPKMEAKLLEQHIETISIGILRLGRESQLPYFDFIKTKYLKS